MWEGGGNNDGDNDDGDSNDIYDGDDDDDGVDDDDEVDSDEYYDDDLFTHSYISICLLLYTVDCISIFVYTHRQMQYRFSTFALWLSYID